MSVLGTICLLKDFPLIDRWGETAKGVTADVHAATTMGYHVHLSITYQTENWSPDINYAEVQLDPDQALELGKALTGWAEREKERIKEDKTRE